MQPHPDFPLLTDANHADASPEDVRYNCIAYAAGDTSRKWWPLAMGGYYWPPGAPFAATIPAFTRTFMAMGYSQCSTPRLEPGYEKVAIYAKGAVPQHAARQRDDGVWLSKMGEYVDIEHKTVFVVAGGMYGDPVVFLRRPTEAAMKILFGVLAGWR